MVTFKIKTNFLRSLPIIVLLATAFISTYSILDFTVYAKSNTSSLLDGTDIDDTFEDGTKIDKEKYGKGDAVENGFNFRDDELNGKNAFKYLNKNYGQIFSKIKSLPTDSAASVHYKKYDAVDFRTIYYGDASDASHLQINDMVGSQRRYIGVEFTKVEPTHNPKVSYDYCTDGTLLARRVLYKPTENPGSIPTANNVVKTGSRKFNFDDTVKVYYENLDSLKSGKVQQLQRKSGKAIREEWSDLIYDKYADDDVIRLNKQQKHKGCYLRPKYGDMHANHIQLKYSNKINRIDHFHVTVPPTELTDGQTYEWHNGSNYDGFRLSYKYNANFKAVDITYTTIGSILDASFEVQNDMSNFVDTGEGIPSEFALRSGGTILFEGRSPQLQPKWNGKEKQETILFTSYMVAPKYINKDMKIYAKFNPDEGDTFYESNYDDNSITKNLKIEGFVPTNTHLTCMKSYFGTTKDYGLLETIPGTDTTVCNTYSVTLNDAVEVSTQDADHTTLTGVWSSNSRGHYKYKDEIASKDVGKQDTLRATGKPRFSGENVINTKVTNFKVPGISKLGRVIRAGRNVEMYSGIYIRITAQSFSGYSAAESAVNNMYNYMLGKTDKNKFVSKGDRVVGNTVKGKLKDNKGKTETPAQIDGHRSAKVIENTRSKMKFGNCSNTPTKYTVAKKYYVPLATKNAGGKQTTQNGDFAPTKDYSVTSDSYKLFTSIDNPDGIYNLFFRNYIKPTIFEGVGNPEEYCDTTPEKFIIQGNLYDDVRTEDKTDNNTLQDLSW